MTAPPEPKGDRGSPQVRTRTSRTRDNTRIMESLCRKLLLCKEERWQTTTGTRLPTNQQMDYEKPKRLPSDSTSY